MRFSSRCATPDQQHDETPEQKQALLAKLAPIDPTERRDVETKVYAALENAPAHMLSSTIPQSRIRQEVDASLREQTLAEVRNEYEKVLAKIEVPKPKNSAELLTFLEANFPRGYDMLRDAEKEFGAVENSSVRARFEGFFARVRKFQVFQGLLRERNVDPAVIRALDIVRWNNFEGGGGGGRDSTRDERGRGGIKGRNDYLKDIIESVVQQGRLAVKLQRQAEKSQRRGCGIRSMSRCSDEAVGEAEACVGGEKHGGPMLRPRVSGVWNHG